MDKKYVKIVYEDFRTNNSNRYHSEIKSDMVEFDGYNTCYINEISYEDNFDAFVHDLFSFGFLYLNDGRAIPVFNIKFIEMVREQKLDSSDNTESAENIVKNPNEVKRKRKRRR
jgi:hypothetical protein